MKISWKTFGTLVICMAFLFGIQQISFQKIINVKAQTARMLAGPSADPFSTTYLTPISSSPNSNLPTYALPRVHMKTYTNVVGPMSLDLNADGLIDIAYSTYVDSGADKYEYQYVILNTGSGFELAYVCQHQYVSGIHTYKGDCAAQ